MLQPGDNARAVEQLVAMLVKDSRKKRKSVLKRSSSTLPKARAIKIEHSDPAQNMSVIADALPAAPGKVESPSAFIRVFSVF